MTTALDTNIIVALWNQDPDISLAAETALEGAFRPGSLVVSAPVFAELIAGPGRTEAFVNAFLQENGIVVEWDLEEAIWRSVGRAFQAYAERRHRHRDTGTRRVLADFLIGGHAQVRGYRLLTLDERLYRAAFPTLKVETV